MSYPDGDEGVARGWAFLVQVDSAAAVRWALQRSALAAASNAQQTANVAEKGAEQASLWAAGKGQGQIDEIVWAENLHQAEFLRDIFNPFHPIPLNPSWQTSTVLALAQGIYQDRAFDRLPILADALQDASCDNPDLLNHLRSEGPHTRGCWALDLCLNRE